MRVLYSLRGRGALVLFHSSVEGRTTGHQSSNLMARKLTSGPTEFRIPSKSKDQIRRQMSQTGSIALQLAYSYNSLASIYIYRQSRNFSMDDRFPFHQISILSLIHFRELSSTTEFEGCKNTENRGSRNFKRNLSQ